MPPKASTKSAPSGRQSNPRASTKVKPGAYAEHQDEDAEDGDEIEGKEEDESQEPEDLMSTLDLAAVMKAFANSGARKEQTEGKAVEKELAALLEKTQAGVDSFFATEHGKCESFIKSLKLDDAIVAGTDERAIRLQFEDRQRESSEIITQLNEITAGLRPANNTFYADAVATVTRRSSRVRKLNKRFARQVRVHADEQNEVMQLYAESGPEAARGFRLALRGGASA